MLLYQECSPACPGQGHCPELGLCDFYHKIFSLIHFHPFLLHIILIPVIAKLTLLGSTLG